MTPGQQRKILSLQADIERRQRALGFGHGTPVVGRVDVAKVAHEILTARAAGACTQDHAQKLQQWRQKGLAMGKALRQLQTRERRAHASVQRLEQRLEWARAEHRQVVTALLRAKDQTRQHCVEAVAVPDGDDDARKLQQLHLAERINEIARMREDLAAMTAQVAS